MTKIFLSYARADGSEIATELADRLRVLGHEVFLDVQSITGGTQWRPELNKRVRWADLVVVLVTETSNDSDHVFQEILTATQHSKMILPVQVDETPLPVHLRGTWQAVKFQDGNYENVLLEIERAVRHLPHRRLASPWWIGGMMVVFIAIAALAGGLLLSQTGGDDDTRETSESGTVAAAAGDTATAPTQVPYLTDTPNPTSSVAREPTNVPTSMPQPPQWEVRDKDDLNGPGQEDDWTSGNQIGPRFANGKMVFEGTDQDWDIGANSARIVGPGQGVLVLFRFQSGLLLMQIDHVNMFSEELLQTWQFVGKETGVWEVGQRWGTQGNNYVAHTASWFEDNVWYYAMFRLGTDNRFSMFAWQADAPSNYHIEYVPNIEDVAENSILRNFGFAAYGGVLEIELVEWLSFPPGFEMPDLPPYIPVE